MHHFAIYAAEPKRFGSLPSCANHTIKRIHPITGMIQSSWNHPLLSMSCSLRAPTARPGKIVPSKKSASTFSSMMFEAIDANTTNRVHHQNSGRDARPLKSAYLEKQILIDSPKVICCLFIYWFVEKNHVSELSSAVVNCLSMNCI